MRNGQLEGRELEEDGITKEGSEIKRELLGALVPFKPGGQHGWVLVGAGIHGQPFLGGFYPSSFYRRMGVIELAPVRF